MAWRNSGVPEGGGYLPQPATSRCRISGTKAGGLICGSPIDMMIGFLPAGGSMPAISFASRAKG
jgi:hypothetical protein